MSLKAQVEKIVRDAINAIEHPVKSSEELAEEIKSHLEGWAASVTGRVKADCLTLQRDTELAIGNALADLSTAKQKAIAEIAAKADELQKKGSN